MKMKQTLAFLAAVAFTGAAYAAGPVFVNNWGPPESPIYYMTKGTVLPAGLVTITANGAVFPGSENIPVADGFFDNGFGATGAPDGSDVTFKAVVTTSKADEKGEATWSQKVGTTPALPAAPAPTDMMFPEIIVKAGGVEPPKSVPEPSMIALALLGGAALLLRRRN